MLASGIQSDWLYLATACIDELRCGTVKPQIKKLIALIIPIIVGVIVFQLVAHYDEILPYQWQTFRAPDGAFSVSLPGRPEIKDQQAPVAGGRNITVHMANNAPNKYVFYSCSYFQNPSLSVLTPDEMLSSSRDGSLKNIQGTLIAEKRITVDGHPGRDIQALARENSAVDERLVAVGNRLYMLMVIHAGSHGRDTKNIQKFFDSFKINSK